MAEQEQKIEKYCDICGEEIKDKHCTYDVCKKCCNSMICDKRYVCRSYPMTLEEIIKDSRKPKQKIDLNGEFS